MHGRLQVRVYLMHVYLWGRSSDQYALAASGPLPHVQRWAPHSTLIIWLTVS